MSWSDFKVITLSAALTMMVGVPLLLPAVVTAGPGDALVLVEQPPALELSGCSVAARLAKDKYEAGEAVEIIATVTSGAKATVKLPLHVTLMNQPYSPPFSRMMMPPMAAWEHDLIVEVAPGEVKEIRLKTKFKGGDGATVSVLAGAQGKDAAAVNLASAFIGEVTDPLIGGGIKLELLPEPVLNAPVAVEPAPAPIAQVQGR